MDPLLKLKKIINFFWAFLVCFILTQGQFSYAAHPENVWRVMRDNFKIPHETYQFEVQEQIRWLKAHPGYLQHLTRHSEPYIYHILNTLKARNLPAEIAIIPMLESSYDPFVYSGSGAAGLWQIIPSTGHHLGLKQDWWYDGRKGIGPSTNAALNYLSKLHQMFNNNWLLAIAAYDAGEGSIARAIKNSGQTNKVDFWTLSISRETKLYIPRLLAIAEIINNPQKYGITLPDIAYRPYFTEVNVGSQIHLNHAAKLAGISFNDLKKLNPQFKQTATAPNHPHTLLIPANKADDFMRKLALIPPKQRMSIENYHVSPGENLKDIAKAYKTTPDLIKEINELQSNSIKKHQYVLIPGFNKTKITEASMPPSILSSQNYQVHQGDTLYSIAKKFNVSVSKLIEWNHLNAKKPLKIGQKLSVGTKTTPKPIIAKQTSYSIKKGDSLSLIAKRLKIKVAQIKKLNPNLNERRLKPGQILRVS